MGLRVCLKVRNYVMRCVGSRACLEFESNCKGLRGFKQAFDGIQGVVTRLSGGRLASGIEMQGHWAGRGGPGQKMSLEDAETLGANR